MEVNKLKVFLSRKLDMKDLGATKKILGMEILRDRDARRLWLSQASYVKKVLERFSMEDAKPVKKLKTCLICQCIGVSDVRYGMY